MEMRNCLSLTSCKLYSCGNWMEKWINISRVKVIRKIVTKIWRQKWKWVRVKSELVLRWVRVCKLLIIYSYTRRKKSATDWKIHREECVKEHAIRQKAKRKEGEKEKEIGKNCMQRKNKFKKRNNSRNFIIHNTLYNVIKCLKAKFMTIWHPIRVSDLAMLGKRTNLLSDGDSYTFQWQCYFNLEKNERKRRENKFTTIFTISRSTWNRFLVSGESRIKASQISKSVAKHV